MHNTTDSLLVIVAKILRTDWQSVTTRTDSKFVVCVCACVMAINWNKRFNSTQGEADTSNLDDWLMPFHNNRSHRWSESCSGGRQTSGPPGIRSSSNLRWENFCTATRMFRPSHTLKTNSKCESCRHWSTVWWNVPICEISMKNISLFILWQLFESTDNHISFIRKHFITNGNAYYRSAPARSLQLYASVLPFVSYIIFCYCYLTTVAPNSLHCALYH